MAASSSDPAHFPVHHLPYRALCAGEPEVVIARGPGRRGEVGALAIEQYLYQRRVRDSRL